MGRGRHLKRSVFACRPDSEGEGSVRKLVTEMKLRKEQGETDLIIAQGRIVKKWWVSQPAQD